ncbi:MAG: DMT family transporter [Trueperaceae bacterium]
MADAREPLPARPRRLFDRPYLLLTLAVAFWAGNFVLGRAVRDVVPPVTLAFWRWALASLVVSPVALPRLRAAMPVVRAHAGLIVALSFLGITVFNTLIYLGLHSTTAVNAVLLQSLMPVAIVLLAMALDGARLRPVQTVGIALSLTGAVWVLVRGDLTVLAGLRLAPGDGLVLIAVLSYAAYSVLLRRRPALDPFVFLWVTFVLGMLMLAPAFAVEWLTGPPVHFGLAALASFAYVGIFPSVLSFLFFNRGVELVGPERAGLFIHLMPVFGSVLSVALLGEAVRPYHAVGIVAILAGIGLATRTSPQRRITSVTKK